MTSVRLVIRVDDVGIMSVFLYRGNGLHGSLMPKLHAVESERLPSATNQTQHR